MKSVPHKIRDDKLWKDVYTLVEGAYAKIDDLIAGFPDEQWTTAAKLRNAASDSLFYVSLATGSAAPETGQYDWSNARKNLFALQAMYTFAAKQKFFELEPEVVVKIDSLLEQIDKKLHESKAQWDKRNQEELEPWLEKYRIWQKISEVKEQDSTHESKD
jgi:hypothetical protein